jgi:hypothetical protein
MCWSPSMPRGAGFSTSIRELGASRTDPSFLCNFWTFCGPTSLRSFPMATKSIPLLLATFATFSVVLLVRETVPAPAPVPSAGAVISMAASAWVFQFSAAVPQNPTQAGTGWYFDFPADCAIDPTLGYKPCSVNYLVTGFGGAITHGKTISMNYEIDLTGSPIFNYIINPDNTCGSGSPGTVRLYFQQVGDNLSGNGAYEFYRWFSTPATLAPGSNTLSVVLAGANWISVYGKVGNDPTAATGFAAAIADIGHIGMVFGGGCFASHGVNIQGSGTARFTVNSYGVP